MKIKKECIPALGVSFFITDNHTVVALENQPWEHPITISEVVIEINDEFKDSAQGLLALEISFLFKQVMDQNTNHYIGVKYLGCEFFNDYRGKGSSHKYLLSVHKW